MRDVNPNERRKSVTYDGFFLYTVTVKMSEMRAVLVL